MTRSRLHPGSDSDTDFRRRRLLDGFFSGLAMAAVLPSVGRAGETGNTPSMMAVDLPAVDLIRHDGRAVHFQPELDDGRAVYLHFIFTSCAAICPASSQLFAQLQRRLGPRGKRVHLVSVSIDPENDTPARLREYALEHGASPGWDHYTGTVIDSERLQRAFGAWRGDKMNHLPSVWFRAKPGAAWHRMDGFITPSDLLAQLQSSSSG